MCNLYLCPSIFPTRPNVCVIQARLEVHRFGITGFKKEEQRVFEQDRAVMLGARVSRRDRRHARINHLFYDPFTTLLSSLHQPPRREYVNYKLLQQQVQQKKKEKEGAVQPVRARNNHVCRGPLCTDVMAFAGVFCYY